MAQHDAHTNSFLIAALGAFGGGLEAFEQFFEQMPAEAGIAFVTVPASAWRFVAKSFSVMAGAFGRTLNMGSDRRSTLRSLREAVMQ